MTGRSGGASASDGTVGSAGSASAPVTSTVVGPAGSVVAVFEAVQVVETASRVLSERNPQR